MDKTERFHRLKQLFRGRRALMLKYLCEELEVSPATVKRDIEYLRDRIKVPILWDRELCGYRIDSDPEVQRSELPGLWFSSAEVCALLTMEHLLENLQPGFLTRHIEPLRERISALLEGSTGKFVGGCLILAC